MTIEPYYPPVEEQTAFAVEVLLKLLDQDPDHLERPECPYSDDVRNLLKRLAEKRQSTAEVEDLEDEAGSLFQKLKELGTAIDAADTKDRVAYMRVATSLFDKLITLKERSAGMKKMAEFQRTVLDVIDSVMTPEQRTIMMDRLSKLQIQS